MSEAILGTRRGMGKRRPKREQAGQPSQAFCMHAGSVKSRWLSKARRGIEAAAAGQAAASGYWAEGALGGKVRIGQESERGRGV